MSGIPKASAFSSRGAWRAQVPLAVGSLLLVAWVQRHALSAFFSSPDDLIHLQQAVGLRPTVPTPLRFLSQVLYFRAMVGLFGPNPLPFHIATCVAHLVNVLLVFLLAKAAGVQRVAAALGAALFGLAPLHLTLLSSAVGMNDELALGLTLLALLFALRDGRRWIVLSVSSFLLALLCKESVIFLPVLLLIARRKEDAWRAASLRVAPLLAVAAAVGGLFIALRPFGLAPGGPVYTVHLGGNIFHNLMTYTSWSVNLWEPIPDLVTSFSPTAWRSGLWVVAALGLAAWLCREERHAIKLGLGWWLLGLMPVLPLQLQTYRHYLYPALPGLALGVAGTVSWTFSSLARRVVGSARGRSQSIAVTALALCAMAYAVRADQLIVARLEKEVPSLDLPLDPVLRRRVVAQRALASMGQFLGPGPTKIAILVPEGTGRVFGVRSGKEYQAVLGGQHPYGLLEESIDHGGAVKLFYPQVDSVAFVSRWTPAYRDFELFLPYREGFLLGVGGGPVAHGETAKWMMEQGWYPQARNYLKAVLEVYPSDPALRLAYGAALFKSGERTAAMGQLREVIRTAPDDSAALAARRILEALDSRHPPGPGGAAHDR